MYEREIWQVKYPNCDWEDELVEDWVFAFKDKRRYDEYGDSRIRNPYFTNEITDIRTSCN